MEQTRFFEEKLRNAKRVIETVYRGRGHEAFLESVEADAVAVGITPAISDHEMDLA